MNKTKKIIPKKKSSEKKKNKNVIDKKTKLKVKVSEKMKLSKNKKLKTKKSKLLANTKKADSKKIKTKEKKIISRKSEQKKDMRKSIIKPDEKKEKIIVSKKNKPESGLKKEAEINIKPIHDLSVKENVQKPMILNSNSPYFTILFVCTGNMCRSPLAEGIMKKKIEEEFSGEVKEMIMVHSCGTYAYDGNKPSENAIKTAKQNNMDISYIRSKPLTKLVVEEADIIFALSLEHLNYIHENFLSAKNKTFLLKQFGENRLTQMADSIPDPMGFTIEYYTKTYQEIKNAIDKIFPLIHELIQKKFQNRNEKNN